MSTITIEIELLGNEIKVEIDYDFQGKNIAATYFQPAEYSELVINTISREFASGELVDLTEMLTTEELEKIEVITQEWLNEE